MTTKQMLEEIADAIDCYAETTGETVPTMILLKEKEGLAISYDTGEAFEIRATKIELTKEDPGK